MEGVQIIVYASGEQWDEFYINAFEFLCKVDHDNFIKGIDDSKLNLPRNCKSDLNSSKYCCQRSSLKESISQDSYFSIEGKTLDTKQKLACVKQCYKTKMTGYLLSVFVNTLRTSEFYRSAVLSHLLWCKNIEHNNYSSQYPLKLIIQLCDPCKNIIDYSWNERMLTMALERRELDHAMSWLSTLGGAFSALGDHNDRCAVVAGCISIKQMKLALRLGDPLTVARCKLYLSLSLLQRGYLKKAKHIIKEQFQLARSAPVIDMRLIRMCYGIWAKLKYTCYTMKVERNAIS